MASSSTPNSLSFAACSVNSSRVVELDNSSPIVRVHGRPFAKNDTSKFVHEHLVRERSNALAKRISVAKSKIKDGEMATINIQANKRNWTDYPDEMLGNVVEVYTLAYTYGDCECVNACLDAIRGALVEKRCDVDDPLTLLLTMFQEGRCDKTCDMIVHSLVYGPCLDSGVLNRWLDKLNVIRDDVPDRWAPFYDKLCKALATRCAAQASGNLDSLPDSMAAQAYHLCKPGEKLCCGREVPVESRKRKATPDDLDEQPDFFRGGAFEREYNMTETSP